MKWTDARRLIVPQIPQRGAYGTFLGMTPGRAGG